MILDIPVCYFAMGRRAGKKIAAGHYFTEELRIEVPVLEDHAAPVVVSWEDRPLPDEAYPMVHWGEGDSPVGPEHVRLVDGKFFRPLRVKDIGGASVEPVGENEFVQAAAQGMLAGLLRLPAIERGKQGAASDHFETLLKSGREAVLQPIRESLANLFVVDGSVYIRCEEPFVCVWRARFGRSNRLGQMNAVWSVPVARVVTSMPTDEAMIFMDLSVVQGFRKTLGPIRRMNAANEYNRQQVEEFNAGAAPHIHQDWYVAPDQVAASECRIVLRSFLRSVSQREGVALLRDVGKLSLYCQLVKALDALPDDEAMQTVENAGGEWLEKYSRHGVFYGFEEANEKETLAKAVGIAAERPVYMEIGRAKFQP